MFSRGGQGRGQRSGGGYGDLSAASTAHASPNPYSNSARSTPGSYQNKPPHQQSSGNTVYVGNLNSSTDKDQLMKTFAGLRLDVRKVNILLNEMG